VSIRRDCKHYKSKERLLEGIANITKKKKGMQKEGKEKKKKKRNFFKKGLKK